MSAETEIQGEVEALKTRFSDTKALYREVCALLFFRYGITPTTNKLYQYVRRGSMSAPADALAKFWDDLRSKARIEIDHPDLPSDVKDAAATAIAAVWRQASAAARDELRSLRDAVNAELVDAQAEVQAAQDLHSTLLDNIELVRGQLVSADAAAVVLRADLEAERRSHAASAARIHELQRTTDDLRAQSQRLQDGFSADLAKAREANDAANARADASERRALLEIDQERQSRSRAEKALETFRTQSAQNEERLRAEAQAATETSVRQIAQLETLARARQELAEKSERATALSDALKAQLRTAEDNAAHAKAEAQTLQRVLERIAPDMRDAAPPATTGRARRRLIAKDAPRE